MVVVRAGGQWQGARWDRELGPGVPDGGEGRDGRGQEGQMAVAGVVGQEGCWEGGPDGRSGWAGG